MKGCLKGKARLQKTFCLTPLAASCLALMVVGCGGGGGGGSPAPSSSLVSGGSGASSGGSGSSNSSSSNSSSGGSSSGGSSSGGSSSGGSSSGGSGSQNQGVAQVSYVAPVSVTAPDYTRRENSSLKYSQPTPSANTRPGYSAVDVAHPESDLIEKWYGADEDAYAKSLAALKSTVDTRGQKIGVIDSGVYGLNKDLILANLGWQIECRTLGETTCYTPENDSGIRWASMYTKPSSSHGSQMASIIAGNNGLTNATVYSSKSAGTSTNGGNQFLMMRKLNKDYGVTIFNNSWGVDGSEWLEEAKRLTYNKDTGEVTLSSTNTTNAVFDLPVLHDLIVNRDALIVKSAGNDAKEDADTYSLAPQLNEKFKDGFVVAVAPREDFAQSNLCGQAAAWCIGAIGSTKNYDNDGNLVTTIGTSNSAARVTAAAVLTKAAYPWMTNQNLSQTLFSTAKDLGEIAKKSPTYKGLQPITAQQASTLQASGQNVYSTTNGNYFAALDTPWETRTVVQNHNGKDITRETGWGLLDTEAAAKGYGGFYWDNVVLDTKGTPLSVFYNDIKGDKGFTKKGEGRLVFVGNNSYKGDSIVDGGVLQIDGASNASAFRLQSGELTGYGSIKSLTQTGGWLNNEGNLTIKGDYTATIASSASSAQSATAGFKARFGNALQVDGKATLDGSLWLTGEAKDGLISAQGSKSAVLRANGGISGTFDNYTSVNPLFEITDLSYSAKLDAAGNPTSNTAAKDVVVTAKRKSAASAVSTLSVVQSAPQVLSNLDKVLEQLDAKQQSDALSADEKTFADKVVASFANMVQTSSVLASEELQLSEVAVNQQLTALDPSFYLNGAAYALEESAEQAHRFTSRLSDAQGKTVWGGFEYQDYQLDFEQATGDRASRVYNAGIGGVVGNTRIAAQLDVGDLTIEDNVHGIGSRADAQTVGLSAGFAKELGGDAVAAVWTKAAVVRTKAERASAKAIDYDGHVYGAGAQLGKRLAVGNWSVRPYASLDYHYYANRDKNLNDGTNVLGELSAKQTQAGFGADARYAFGNWQAFGDARFVRVLDRDARLNTRYVGTDTDVDFVDGWDSGKNKFSLALGLNYQIGKQSLFGVDYRYTDGSKTDSSRVGVSLVSRF